MRLKPIIAIALASSAAVTAQGGGYTTITTVVATSAESTSQSTEWSTPTSTSWEPETTSQSYGPYTITEADHTETITLPIQPIPTSGWTTTTYTVPGATVTEPIPIGPTGPTSPTPEPESSVSPVSETSASATTTTTVGVGSYVNAAALPTPAIGALAGAVAAVALL